MKEWGNHYKTLGDVESITIDEIRTLKKTENGNAVGPGTFPISL